MIIDHMERLQLGDDEAGRHFNELRSLGSLAMGLEYLNTQVLGIEWRIRNSLTEDQPVYIFGNSPLLKGAPHDLIACFFHWYSVTACNYVRLVGWLGYGGDPKKARNYLKNVMPEVSLWRDKVGAHFSRVDPRETGPKADSEADRAKSVTFPVAFEDDAFYTDPFVLKIASGEQWRPRPEGVADWRWRLIAMSGRRTEVSNHQMRWSLTKTHKDLSIRYWPANHAEGYQPPRQ